MHLQFLSRWLVFMGALWLCYGSNAADSPNIVLFLGDNWSWPHTGALGDPLAKTPVFDRVAREGVLFNHAFCPVPSCSPTRSSIVTGRAAHQLEEAASLWSIFRSKFKSFVTTLRDAGYEVGYSGKGWSPGLYLEYGWTENPAGPQFASFAEFMAQRDPAKPFFFWQGNVSTALHQWKYEPNQWQHLDESALKIPAELPDTEEVRSSMMAYYVGVGIADQDAGRCVAELESRDLLDDTLFVYTTDNGWQMPRGLANCYDSGTRVPMAVRWGSRLEPGKRVDDFVCLTDLAPTFLEAVGLKPGPEMTGHSFLDVLLGKPSAVVRDHVFVERERHANVRRGDLSYPIRGIRTQDFLYLWNMRPDRWPAGDPKAYWAVGDFGDVDGSRAKIDMLAKAQEPEMKKYIELCFAKRPAEELYDLRTDSRQIQNVAQEPEYADTKAQLRAQVEQWMRDTDDPRVDPNNDDWDSYPYFGGRVVDEQGNPIVKETRPTK
jgi:arylsulfatase A-like enzyme